MKRRHPQPPSIKRGPEFWRRRGERATCVRLCGRCKGTGARKTIRRTPAFWFWVWRDGEYREVAYFPPDLACGTCGGSGLNCSQRKARELETALNGH